MFDDVHGDDDLIGHKSESSSRPKNAKNTSSREFFFYDSLFFLIHVYSLYLQYVEAIIEYNFT